jgi:hypothetical protein
MVKVKVKVKVNVTCGRCHWSIVGCLAFQSARADQTDLPICCHFAHAKQISLICSGVS